MQSLNPLVTVETLGHSSALEQQSFDSLVQRVDLVCATDWDRDGLVSLWIWCIFGILSVYEID